MTITSTAGAGITVNSAAKDSAGAASTLGSQTAAAENQIIVPDAITANNEGNLESSPTYVGRLIQIREGATGVETVTINNGGTGYAVNDVLTDNGAGATAARRARFIVTAVSSGVITGIKLHEAGDAGSPAVTVGADRGEYSVEGTATGRATTGGTGSSATVDCTFQSVDEHRYINDDTSNTLTLHENWIDGPASGENWRVPYIIGDVATVTGLSLINKRLSDYSSTRRLNVANTGWLAFLDGVSLETSDESTTNFAACDVRISGRFDNGYLAGGVPVSGGYFIGTPAVSEEAVLSITNSSDAQIPRMYDLFFTCVVDNQMEWIDCIGDRIKLFRPSKIFMSSGIGPTRDPDHPFHNLIFNDIRFEWDSFAQGIPSPFNYIQVDQGLYMEDATFIKALAALAKPGFGGNAFYGRIVIKDVVFVNNYWDIWFDNSVGDNGFVITLLNPVWAINDNLGGQSIIRFGSRGQIALLSKCQVRAGFVLNFGVLDDTLTPVTDAAIHLVEGSLHKTILAGTSNTLQGFETSPDEDGDFQMDVITDVYRDALLFGGASFGPDGTNGMTWSTNDTTRVSTLTRLDGGSFITDGFAVGNWVRVWRGAGSGDDLGYTYQLTAVAAGTLTMDNPVARSVSTVESNDFTADVNIQVNEVSVEREARATFGLRAYKYGKIPYLAAQSTIESETEVPVTLLPDPNITEANQATAISNGSGIVVEPHPHRPRGPFNIQSAAADASGSTIDLSYTMPSGVNNGALVVIASADGSNNWPTGVDFGVGVDALTEANNVGASSGVICGQGIWYLLNPAAATRTIRATFGSAATDRRIQAFYLENIAQSSPIDATVEDNFILGGNNYLTLTSTVANTIALWAFRHIVTTATQVGFWSESLGSMSAGEIAGSSNNAQGAFVKQLRTADGYELNYTWPIVSGGGYATFVTQAVNFKAGGDTQPILVLNYDGGIGGLPTVGETITIDNAGADTTGTLHEYIGDAVSGTLVLTNWNGTAAENNVGITGSSSSFSATSHTSGAGSFLGSYTWLVDCNSKAMTAVYDYLLAKMSEIGDSLDPVFREAIAWGEGEQSNLVYSDGTNYWTERNVNNAEGVWLSNRGAGSISYMTSDNGNQFVPPVTINVTFTGLKDNTEVRVYTANTSDELDGVENATAGSPDNRSVTFSLTAGTTVDIRFMNQDWIVPDRNSILDFVWPSVNTSIPITQVVDRNFNNPP